MNQATPRGQQRIPPLQAILIAALAIYGGLGWAYRLWALLPYHRSTIASVTKEPWLAVGLLSLAGIGLYSLYACGLLRLWWSRPNRRTLWWIWAGAAVAGLLMVVTYPVTSTDIFDYLFRGRIGAYYGKNPYIDLPNQFRIDPLFDTIGWPNAPSAYGPLWELMSRGLAAIGGSSLLVNVLLHKIVALATYLLVGLVILWMMRPSGWRAQAIGSFLWLWSPLALWETISAGHNDGLLILAVLLAVWATEQRRIRWAVLALTIGTLLKFLPAILLPLVIVYGMRSETTWNARVRLLIASAAIFGVASVLAYLPYWQGWNTLNNIKVREGFVTSAPLAVVSYFLRQAATLQRINELLTMLHLPHPANADDVMIGVSRLATGLLALGLMWQMWQIWRNGRGIWRATFGLLLWYLVLGSQWFQPWYVLWLLALMAVRPEGRTIASITVWSLAGQASYFLQYFFQPELSKRYGAEWSGQGIRVQALYCTIIFVPPLLMWAAWLAGRGSRRRRGQAGAAGGPPERLDSPGGQPA